MLQTAIASKNVPTPKVGAKVIEKTKTRLSSMATPPGFSSATQRVIREVTFVPSIVSVIIQWKPLNVITVNVIIRFMLSLYVTLD